MSQITLANVFQELADKLTHDEVTSEWTPLRLAPDPRDEKEAQAYLLNLQQHPKRFMMDKLGVTNTWSGQDEVMEKIARHGQVAVQSGHALGKDFISARLIHWFIYSHMPAIVIATAPTDRQVEKVIWGELEEAYYKAPQTLPGRLLTKQLIVDEKKRWYAMGFTTKDVRKSPGKFQGFHSPNVLVIFSEAQAIERTIWEQAESLMTAGNAKWLAIGNPLVNFGPFYEACQPGSGWVNVRLDCEDSPNVKERREVVPGLASFEWVERMASKHGRGSSTYRSKVKGLFPTKGVESFIDARWVEWAFNNGPLAVKPNGVRVLGVDLSGKGNDKTVITVRDGMRVVEMRKYTVDETIIWRDGETVREPRAEEQSRPLQAADTIEELIRAGCFRCYLDVGGIGEVVYDYLVRRGLKSKVVPINFGGRPQVDENDPAQANLDNKERFKDMVSQMYGRFAKILELRQASLPNDPDLQMQLVSRKMGEAQDGKKKLESKEEYKSRGFDSPDEADSVVLAYCDVEPREQEHETYVEVDEADGGYAGLWGR